MHANIFTGDESRPREHRRTPRSFSGRESIQSRVSSKNHLSAEDLTQKEDEQLRGRSSHRNYTACGIEASVPSRESRAVSPPQMKPLPAQLPPALQGTSSRPAFMMTPQWSSSPLLELERTSSTPGIRQQTSLRSPENSNAQSVYATSLSGDPFHVPSTSNPDAQRMQVVFPVNVPVNCSPSENFQYLTYGSASPPPDLPTTLPSTDQEGLFQSTFDERMDAFSGRTSAEALPPGFPPSQPLPPEPPPFLQPSVSISISSLENARAFPRAPGQQPVSLVVIITSIKPRF